ncbi:MAG: sulfotransferase [Caulobacteraceae bacterium]|nr:sulfotransferase [Caulobacteraceae bacterium]
MTHHWLVAGVGRSGTTAIYEALQAFARRRRGFRYFYEPYLWGPPTWGSNFRRVAGAFATTNSIHADGLRCHLATPLFASETQERPACHRDFVQGLFEAGAPVLAKIIRGCGRLDDYLRLRPRLKLVFVIRNPLDCVNSAMGNFSFFGDEFHPSDKPRFHRELEAQGRPQPAFATEAEAATAWWHEMNQAALRAFEGRRDRVFIAPHEAYGSDPEPALRLLANFLSLEAPQTRMGFLDEPAGPITRRINLHADDRDHIAPYQTAYFDLLEQVSDIPIGPACHAAMERIEAKYERLEPGAFVPDMPRDASPLAVRALLRRERDARRIALTGIGRAAESLRRLEAEISGGSSPRV